jgi:predicted transport protein
MTELASAVDEVLLGLAGGGCRVERKQYRAYQQLRNFACVCPPQKTTVFVYWPTRKKSVLFPFYEGRDRTRVSRYGRL